jgi:aspartate/methionine/tyrosine aminotransferase
VPSAALVEQLREEKSVFPVPGVAFGLEHYIRIGIGSPAEHLEQGLGRIREFLDERAFPRRAASRAS